MKYENTHTMPEAATPTRGFTLIELLVTLAVAAILLTIAVPNFQSFIINSRMTTQANDLITAMNMARSEAVKRAADVTVCKSAGSSCTTSGNWAQGWIIKDAGVTVLRVQQPLSGKSTLTGGTDVVNAITFTSNGRTKIPVAATEATTTLTLCPPSPATVKGRAIQIERTGRTRVSSVTCP